MLDLLLSLSYLPLELRDLIAFRFKSNDAFALEIVPVQAISFMSSGSEGFFVSNVEPPKIRKEFPETWLWESYEDQG